MGAAGRGEQGIDEDRPFADIRKTIHDALRLLSLRRWAFFVPFCIVSCTAFVLSLYYPRTYRASTTFERRNDPVMVNIPMSAGARSFRYFRTTMVSDLTSVEYMREVVENLGLVDDRDRDDTGALSERAARRRDSLARLLAGSLGVSTVSPSEEIDIIKITYTGPDPNIGKRLVDEVKKTYIRLTMVWIHDYLQGQYEYFTAAFEEAREEVKISEREYTGLRLANPHFDPRNPGALALKLRQLETERKELQLRQGEYEAELAVLKPALAAIDPRVVSSGGQPSEDATVGENVPEPAELISAVALELADRIRDIEHKVQDMRVTRGMTDLHPEIQSLLTRREWLQNEFSEYSPKEQEIALGREPREHALFPPATDSVVSRQMWAAERARLLVQISSEKAKLKDVEFSLGSNQTATEELVQVRQEIYQKQEEFARVSGEVAKAKRKLSQVETTLAMIEPAIKAVDQDRLLQFSVGQPARGSSTPVSPRSATVVLISLLAGIAVGVVFIVLAEVFDHILRSSNQVARGLGLPLLESIDEIITTHDRRRLFVRKVVVSPLVIACFMGLTGLTGSMAYLSLERPSAYQRMSRVPRAVLQLFANTSEASATATASDLLPVTADIADGQGG